MSHVRIADTPDDLTTVRIAPGGADLILGCDVVVSTSLPALSRIDRGATRAIVNADLQPTASFVINPDLDFEMGTMQRILRDAVGDRHLDVIDATAMASALMGDSIATNAFMLGFAFQRGAIPLPLGAIMSAIEINGAAVAMNKQAFTWGRLAAHDPARIRSVLQFRNRVAAPSRDLDDNIARRVSFLTAYQNAVYAGRYRDLVDAVRRAEIAVAPSSTALTEAVATNFFKLMAYKDEYEVARLYTDGTFAAKLGDQFEGDYRISFNLAPPLFSRRDKTTGHLRKAEYGGWMRHAFRLLAAMKGLRGTPFDPFGRTAERRQERQLIDDYEALLRTRLPTLRSEHLPLLTELARVPESIRGYGHIKDASLAKATEERQRLVLQLDNTGYADAAE